MKGTYDVLIFLCVVGNLGHRDSPTYVLSVFGGTCKRISDCLAFYHSTSNTFVLYL